MHHGQTGVTKHAFTSARPARSASLHAGRRPSCAVIRARSWDVERGLVIGRERLDLRFREAGGGVQPATLGG
jgi:hypothetical protein